jgi:CDP-diacylglycerol---glycerol-3-phosphate 3-phosphatidyltransferase
VLRHAANILSLIRIPASLGVLAVYDPHSPIRLWTAVGLVVIIMGSDFFDGRIARKYNLVSKFGYVLDGLGDRACHISAYLLLAITGILNILVVWILIFREISQYAIRLVDLEWHSAQSRGDRAVAQIYTTIVQFMLLLELTRAILMPNSLLPNVYVVGANAVLFVAVTASFSRIVPQFVRIWQDATHG